MKPLNATLSAIGTTIFTVMSALAVRHGSINLGQGFPDTDGPPDVLKAAADALMDGRNQYPPMTGFPDKGADILPQALLMRPYPFVHLFVGTGFSPGNVAEAVGGCER